MAYVNKDKKAKVMAALKLVIPKEWKWSLAVDHHSTLVLTIYSAPINLIEEYYKQATKAGAQGADLVEHVSVNHYHFRRWMEGSRVLPIFEKIVEAMNIDNFDDSDIQSDYFHVGHYVSINLGRWNKPFKVIGDKS